MIRLLVFSTALFSLFSLAACGAFWTEAPADTEIFDGPIQGLTPAQTRTFLAGDEAFRRRFTPETGLGPVFNNVSCESCHTGDGKGHPSTNLTRFGVGDPDKAAFFDTLLSLGGPQLQDKAIPGASPETLPDIAGLAKSIRSGPVVAGLGLIEFLREDGILAKADPEDKDGDGIRGRPNYVAPPPWFEPLGPHTLLEGKIIGRFGRKATAINLMQQIVTAYHQDMGITSPFLPKDLAHPQGGFGEDTTPDPEVSESEVRTVVFYMQTLRPPERRDADKPDVKRGEEQFATIGCASCHTPEMKTGPAPIEALREKTFRPYSDFLLHDMGPDLADGFPEGSATGRDWRTTPLWGLGIVPKLLGGQGFYLHDGRAKTLDEAILLHGGEAEKAKEAYRGLSATEKAEVIAFLDSL